MIDQANTRIPLEALDGPCGCKQHEFGELLDFVNYIFRAHHGRRPSLGGDYPLTGHGNTSDASAQPS